MKYSHSSLATYRRCRYRYWLQYVQNYISPAGRGQVRGTAGHAALAAWYKDSQRDNDAAMKAASDIFTNTELETGWDLAKDWEEMQLVLMRYFAWARVHDQFEALEIELKYDIPIGAYTLTGYIDGIVSKGGYNYVLEHKFVKQASLAHIPLDMQVSIYMLAAHRLGYNPIGTFYNIIRMGERGISVTEPVLRTIAYRNSEGLAVIEYELENNMKEVDEFLAKGGLVYRNPTKDCTWDCSFYDACLSLNDSGEADSVMKKFDKRESDNIIPIEGVIDGTQE